MAVALFQQIGIARAFAMRVGCVALGYLAVKAAVTGLIWAGVSWARVLVLFLIGCHAALVIWSLMFAMVDNQVSQVIFHLNWIDLGLEAAVAYLLLQRESAEWFGPF